MSLEGKDNVLGDRRMENHTFAFNLVQIELYPLLKSMKKSITKYHQHLNRLIYSIFCVILASKKLPPKYHQVSPTFSQ